MSKSTESELRRRVERAELRAGRAERILREEGFEPVHTFEDRLRGVGPSGWTLAEKRKRSLADEREAIEHNATTLARDEALAKVLEALQIPGYARGARPAGSEPGTIFTRSYDTDRFWTDINTALAVREEEKRAQTRKATEQRVKNLVTPKPSLRDLFVNDSIGFLPDSALTSTLNTCVDACCARTETNEPATPKPKPKKPGKNVQRGEN